MSAVVLWVGSATDLGAADQVEPAGVFFKKSVGAKRNDLRCVHGADEKEADRTSADAAKREPALGDKRGRVHQPVRTMLDAIDSAFRDALTGFVSAFLQTSPRRYKYSFLMGFDSSCRTGVAPGLTEVGVF